MSEVNTNNQIGNSTVQNTTNSSNDEFVDMLNSDVKQTLTARINGLNFAVRSTDRRGSAYGTPVQSNSQTTETNSQASVPIVRSSNRRQSAYQR